MRDPSRMSDTSLHPSPAAPPTSGGLTLNANPLHEPSPDSYEQWNRVLGLDPDSCPDAVREAIMVRGAFDALGRRTRELLARLGPILPPGTLTAEVPPRAVPSSATPQTPLGDYLRALHNEVGQLEEAVGGVLTRLGV